MKAQVIAEWVNGTLKGQFPKAVTPGQVAVGIRRAKRTLDRMGIYVRGRPAHDNLTVYFRAAELEKRPQGPALDDFDDSTVHEPKIDPPLPPLPPEAISHIDRDSGEYGGSCMLRRRSSPRIRGAIGQLPRNSPTTPPNRFSDVRDPIGNPSGGRWGLFSQSGEAKSDGPAITGPLFEPHSSPLTEESFDFGGNSRADRARRAWKNDHPEEGA